MALLIKRVIVIIEPLPTSWINVEIFKNMLINPPEILFAQADETLKLNGTLISFSKSNKIEFEKSNPLSDNERTNILLKMSKPGLSDGCFLRTKDFQYNVFVEFYAKNKIKPQEKKFLFTFLGKKLQSKQKGINKKELSRNPSKLESLRAGSNQNFRTGIDDLNEIIKLDPQDADAFYSRGKLFLEDGNFKEAYHDFLAANSLGNKKALEFIEYLKGKV